MDLREEIEKYKALLNENATELFDSENDEYKGEDLSSPGTHNEESLSDIWGDDQSQFDDSDDVDDEELGSPIKQALTHRIMRAHPELLSKYGDEAVMAAIDDVANFAGQPDEIGISDFRSWINQVIKKLSQSSESSDSDDYNVDPESNEFNHLSEDFNPPVKKGFMSARRDGQVNTSGTSKIGSVVTTYRKLVDTFGPPMYGPDEDQDKTTCEWQIKFDDGIVATIYDWKTGATPMYEYGWHVGGYKELAVTNVKEALGITEESSDGSAGSIAITENELCEGCDMPVEECMCESNVGMYESEMDTIMKLSGMKELSEKFGKDATGKVKVDAYDEDVSPANGPDEKTLSTDTQLTSNDDLHRSSKKMYKRAQPGDNPRAVAEAEYKLKQKYAKFLNEQK